MPSLWFRVVPGSEDCCPVASGGGVEGVRRRKANAPRPCHHDHDGVVVGVQTEMRRELAAEKTHDLPMSRQGPRGTGNVKDSSQIEAVGLSPGQLQHGVDQLVVLRQVVHVAAQRSTCGLITAD